MLTPSGAIGLEGAATQASPDNNRPPPPPGQRDLISDKFSPVLGAQIRTRKRVARRKAVEAAASRSRTIANSSVRDLLQAGKTTNSNTIEARKTLGLTMEIGVSTAS